MEWEILQRLRSGLPLAPPGELWIGDDAAAVVMPEGLVLLAADAVVAGVHADMDLVSAADFGWKAIAVNVSDIAAMGGRPLHALCCLAGPPETDVDAVLGGLVEAAGVYATVLVGGDLSNSATLVVTVTITGTTDGRAVVRRSGAEPGDTVFVTGALGGSAAGLAVLRASSPTVRLDEGQASLARAYRRPRARPAEGQVAALAGATAMIDVSDGLVADLGHIATGSGLAIDLDRVPVVPGATESQALGGGEDYQLVFTAPEAQKVLHAFSEAGLEAPIQIGRCSAGQPAVRLNGTALEALGWEHHWNRHPRGAGEDF